MSRVHRPQVARRSSGVHLKLALMAAIVNLHHPAHIVHWHFFEMSVPNIVVLVAVFAFFVLAIMLPFPGAARRRRGGSS
jgi:hypothetical protein